MSGPRKAEAKSNSRGSADSRNMKGSCRVSGELEILRTCVGIAGQNPIYKLVGFLHQALVQHIAPDGIASGRDIAEPAASLCL